jgi:hypothetical protein
MAYRSNIFSVAMIDHDAALSLSIGTDNFMLPMLWTDDPHLHSFIILANFRPLLIERHACWNVTPPRAAVDSSSAWVRFPWQWRACAFRNDVQETKQQHSALRARHCIVSFTVTVTATVSIFNVTKLVWEEDWKAGTSLVVRSSHVLRREWHILGYWSQFPAAGELFHDLVSTKKSFNRCW